MRPLLRPTLFTPLLRPLKPPRLPIPRAPPHRHQSRYQTFRNPAHIHPLRLWARRPTFYYEVSALAALLGALYTANLEQVPYSHRRRFNIVSPEREAAQAATLKDSLLRQYAGRILPARDPRVQTVRRVLARLLPGAGPEAASLAWEVVVVADSQQNAFVIPGGTVFVFTGILDVCGDDAGVATVLGHEMAHTLAHHAAERMSQSLIVYGLIGVAALFGLGDVFSSSLLDLAFLKPGSRAQEAEADYIGLLLMARACFEPGRAVAFWKRMERDGGAAPPAFLSTHPSHEQRVGKIEGWLGEARGEFESGGCGATAGFLEGWREAGARGGGLGV